MTPLALICTIALGCIALWQTLVVGIAKRRIADQTMTVKAQWAVLEAQRIEFVRMLRDVDAMRARLGLPRVDWAKTGATDAEPGVAS